MSKLLEAIEKAEAAGEHMVSNHGHRQVDIAIEELAELIVDIQHYRRGKCGVKKLASEIADALFIVTQLAILFGAKDVSYALEEKVFRTLERDQAGRL
jgi:NTP pyrophosphatase (non-canonical NTP hydrolase)